MLDRGEPALPVIEGRECSSSEVKAAAALMSASSPVAMTFCEVPFPFPFLGCLSLVLTATLASRRLLVCDRVPSAKLLRAPGVEGPLGLAGALRSGVRMRGSLALWIVLACLDGGGANMEA
jgi:hypothetical protein